MAKSKKRRQAAGRGDSPEETAPVGAKEPREAADDPWRQAKGPALRFVLICGGLMLLFYGVFYTSPQESPRLHGFVSAYLGVYATVAGAILDLFGFDNQVLGTTIRIGGGSVSVARGCDAMEPIAFYCAAVVAIQVGLRAKLVGLVAGVSILVLINLGRIIALTVVRMKFPEQFETAHVTVGQTLFVVCTLCLWFLWVNWATRVEDSHGKEPDAAAPA
jgi:exosortase/archaeosortase family protein